LKARREGKLPPFIMRVNPPGYRKKGKTRILWVVLRSDQYVIEGDKIILKGLGAIGWIEVKYKGLIRLKGRQGRLRYATTRIGGDGMHTYPSRLRRRLLEACGERYHKYQEAI